jgi:N utilization substance protein B
MKALMTTKRRKAREEALQLLYAHELSQNSIETILKETLIVRTNGDSFDQFTGDLIKKATETAKESSSLIEKLSHNWDIERIAIIDRLILRMAITEFLYFPEIPPKVTINEALEIARKYSTTESVSFINGILDAILGELTASHRINKEGRGLVSGSSRNRKEAGTTPEE